MTTTSCLKAALALASGRSSTVSLGLMNAGARKKSSPRLVGIVGAFLALPSVRAIIVTRLDAAHRLIGHGDYKTGYAPIEPGQMFAGGLLMLFVQRLLRLDEDTQWMGSE
jgi:hypothetical protein